MYNHKSHSEVFKKWCIALIVVVFALGIIAGFAFAIEKTPDLSTYGRYSNTAPETGFNWIVAIAIWISEVIPATILYAIYSHLENQEIQINILNLIHKKLDEKIMSARED